MRYGTHVVVSAKFGGEFKIMQTMRKTKEAKIDSFAQQSTLNCMRMFSRSFSASINLMVVNNKNSKTNSQTDSRKASGKNDKQKATR